MFVVYRLFYMFFVCCQPARVSVQKGCSVCPADCLRPPSLCGNAPAVLLIPCFQNHQLQIRLVRLGLLPSKMPRLSQRQKPCLMPHHRHIEPGNFACHVREGVTQTTRNATRYAYRRTAVPFICPECPRSPSWQGRWRPLWPGVSWRFGLVDTVVSKGFQTQ